jgi:hypothetical protein
MAVCRICDGDLQGQKAEIERLIAGGWGARKIGARLKINKDVIFRHQKHAMVKSGSIVSQAGSQLRLEQLYESVKKSRDAAIKAGENPKVVATFNDQLLELEKRMCFGAVPVEKKEPGAYRREAIQAVREALGFRDNQPQSDRQRDEHLIEVLKDGAERHQNNEAFLAAACRILSILTQVELPETLEREILKAEVDFDEHDLVDSGDVENGEGGLEEALGEGEDSD